MFTFNHSSGSNKIGQGRKFPSKLPLKNSNMKKPKEAVGAPNFEDLHIPGFDELDLKNIHTIFQICSLNDRKTLEIPFLQKLLSSRLDYQLKYKPQIDKYFQIYMANTGKTEIGFEDFINIMNVQNKKNETIENLRYAFKLFDKEQNGYITLSSLRKVAVEIGEDISENELVEMIEKADQDFDGKVSLQDFYCIFINNYCRI